MQNISLSLLIVLTLCFTFSCSSKKSKARILLFTKTAGFRHESIIPGIEAIKKLGAENGFDVDTTEDQYHFSEKKLSKYNAIVFLNTTGDILGPQAQADFERYIQAGGGYVGIHAAIDAETDWPWYGKLAGAYFESHPHHQEAEVNVIDKSHPSTKGLPEKWKRFDEWYNYKKLDTTLNILAIVDEKTYQGGKHGNSHPVSWCHEFDGGKAFYTALGHTNQSYTDTTFLKHILGGIIYAMHTGELDYSKVHSERVPRDDMFSKEILSEKISDPMELAIDKDRNVFIIERKGNIKVFNPKTGNTILLGSLQVNNHHENGLIGLALDPDYNRNGYLYLHYSAPDSIHQRVSRFSVSQWKIDLNSEKILIESPREKGAPHHTAGSLSFDPSGNLLIAIGDNSMPSQFGAINEVPGNHLEDAQRTAANTNDFRGKILRIHPKEDGSYSIPEGNLFPKDGSKGKPEIYIMGCRNPYRISVDKKKSFLYWGEVGPDAGIDSAKGPRGYDEINEAKGPGNFGWPYFIADNKPYAKVNYHTQTVGALFDPSNLVNESPNNSGQKIIPKPEKALLWYPYHTSEEFPKVGLGGRSAMAGPVYYNDMDNKSDYKFPPYYSNTLFIYDWMRDWIMYMKRAPSGAFLPMERFLPNTPFTKPIDIEFGPDGALYILEYGTYWFDNNDSKLVRIVFNKKNKPPVARITTDIVAGGAPLKVKFSAKKSFDYEEDDLIYEWRFSSDTIVSGSKELTYTFIQPGIYKPSLTVTDEKGNSSVANIDIQVGNHPPEIFIQLSDKSKFYYHDYSVEYNVIMKDKEDGDSDKGQLDPEKISVKFDFIENPTNGKIEFVEEEGKSDYSLRKSLMEGSDCRACHALIEKSVGPSFKEISKRYKGNATAEEKLANKIIEGGGGNWGEQKMSPHPQLSIGAAREMVKYILDLSNERKTINKSLPAKGTITFDKHENKNKKGIYVLSASYKDKGAKGIDPLQTMVNYTFRNSFLEAEETSSRSLTDNLIRPIKSQQGEEMNCFCNQRSFSSYKDIDYTNVSSITFRYTFIGDQEMDILELRTGSVVGKTIGEAHFKPTGGKDNWSEITIPISAPNGSNELFLTFRNDRNIRDCLLFIDWMKFNK